MTNYKPSPFSIRYGSLFAYSPRGQNEASATSRKLCYSIKVDRGEIIARVAGRIAKEARGVLSEIFTPDCVLVPVPRSAPLIEEGALWPPKRICEELIRAGIGSEISPVLSRSERIQKSATAARGERPVIADHIGSLVLTQALLTEKRVVLVDDVVTKGVTFAACSEIIRASHSNIDLVCFAAVRTKGLVPEIQSYIDPAVGSIELLETGVVRRFP